MKSTLYLFLIAAFSLLFACQSPTPPRPVQPEIHALVAKVDTVPNNHYCKTIAGLAKPRAVGVKANYWQPGQTIRIKFISGSQAQKGWVIKGFDTWAEIVNLNFVYVTSGPSEIRVKFDAQDGSWSYIGTDNKSIPNNQPTMNIGWLGLDVALHEIGHALGMAHEQQSPASTICWNKPQVIKDLSGPPNNWDTATIEANVFAQMTSAQAESTLFDPNSIMEYSIPGPWTCNGVGIPGGKVLSTLDKQFIGAKYPKPNQPPPIGKTVLLPAYQRDSIIKWLTASK